MNERVTFKDIIDLAKQGYKPADVKELFALANDQGQAAAGPEDKKTQPDDPGPDEGSKGHGTGAPEGDDKSVDYKEQLTNTQKELEDVKKQLQTLQAANTHADNSGNKPEDFKKDWEEIARSFM